MANLEGSNRLERGSKTRKAPYRSENCKVPSAERDRAERFAK